MFEDTGKICPFVGNMIVLKFQSSQLLEPSYSGFMVVSDHLQHNFTKVNINDQTHPVTVLTLLHSASLRQGCD